MTVNGVEISALIAKLDIIYIHSPYYSIPSSDPKRELLVPYLKLPHDTPLEILTTQMVTNLFKPGSCSFLQQRTQ